MSSTRYQGGHRTSRDTDGFTGLTGRRELNGKTCSQCEVFSRSRYGFCTVAEIEISRDHPICSNYKPMSFMGKWQGAQLSNNSFKSDNTSPLAATGLHLRAYKIPTSCPGLDPEYCASVCFEYWSCKLVLEAARSSSSKEI